METKVVVVIPNWNGADYIRKSLASLQEQSTEATIVVVDNGSVDSSVEIIKGEFPKIKLIELPENTGFDGGVNTGIRYALEKDTEYIAIFNNDAIADPNWLKNLLGRIKTDENLGIVHSKQLRADKKYFDRTGDCYSIWGLPFPRGRNHKDTGQYDAPEEVFSAPAGATLYSVALFKDIGLFDEEFFAYYEDVDISFRARLAGWKVYYEPTGVVYHEVSATSSKLGSFTRFHSIKNFHLLYLKNMPGWLFWKYLPLFTLQSLRLALGALAHRQLFTHIRACFAAIRLIPHALRERRRIQASRKVSVAEIDSLLYHGRPPKIPKPPQN